MDISVERSLYICAYTKPFHKEPGVNQSETWYCSAHGPLVCPGIVVLKWWFANPILSKHKPNDLSACLWSSSCLLKHSLEEGRITFLHNSEQSDVMYVPLIPDPNLALLIRHNPDAVFWPYWYTSFGLHASFSILHIFCWYLLVQKVKSLILS